MENLKLSSQSTINNQRSSSTPNNQAESPPSMLSLLSNKLEIGDSPIKDYFIVKAQLKTNNWWLIFSKEA